MLENLKKKLRRTWFRFSISPFGRFAWYDVYYNQNYRGTVRAYNSEHAIEQEALADAYVRDAEGFAIGINPRWVAKLNSVPSGLGFRSEFPPFEPRFLGPQE